MEIERIEILDADTAFDIALLLMKIEDTNLEPQSYIKFLFDYIIGDTIALFGIYNGDLQGFLQAEQPHPLEPDIGYISVASGQPDLPKEINLEALRSAEEWLASKGAKVWRTKTKRNPELWKKVYGFDCVGEVAGEYILEKKI